MSNTQEIIKLIVNEEFHKAKEEITAALNGKIGVLLEEKLIECGASLFENNDLPLGHQDELNKRFKWEKEQRLKSEKEEKEDEKDGGISKLREITRLRERKKDIDIEQKRVDDYDKATHKTLNTGFSGLAINVVSGVLGTDPQKNWR